MAHALICLTLPHTWSSPGSVRLVPGVQHPVRSRPDVSDPPMQGAADAKRVHCCHPGHVRHADGGGGRRHRIGRDGRGLRPVRQVLAASEGPQMQEIAGAIQEGASAYLSRQFRTLSCVRCPRVRRAVLAAGRHATRAHRSLAVLPRRSGLLSNHGLRGYVACRSRQRTRGRGSERLR